MQTIRKQAQHLQQGNDLIRGLELRGTLPTQRVLRVQQDKDGFVYVETNADGIVHRFAPTELLTIRGK